jgi:hypothetical protein
MQDKREPGRLINREGPAPCLQLGHARRRPWHPDTARGTREGILAGSLRGPEALEKLPERVGEPMGFHGPEHSRLQHPKKGACIP